MPDHQPIDKPRRRRVPYLQRRAANAALAVPKPGMRVRDPAAIAAARKGFCEYCGTDAGPFHVHHLRSRGAGGDDVPGNLINLCAGPGRPNCHDHAHAGHIPREVLARTVAVREGLG